MDASSDNWKHKILIFFNYHKIDLLIFYFCTYWNNVLKMINMKIKFSSAERQIQSSHSARGRIKN